MLYLIVEISVICLVGETSVGRLVEVIFLLLTHEKVYLLLELINKVKHYVMRIFLYSLS